MLQSSKSIKSCMGSKELQQLQVQQEQLELQCSMSCKSSKSCRSSGRCRVRKVARAAKLHEQQELRSSMNR